ncbi:MAG: ATP-binding cassette domain-containing protein [Desulfobacteraceae bacterium]|nr:MAG: ATP-binding cassette domain-containing protein [Desulfobacteraceae bacterium]
MKEIISSNIKIKTVNLSFNYGRLSVLKDISVEFPECSISAIVGPSGKGKSTFLMIFNRLWETIPGARMEGEAFIRLKNKWINIYDRSVSLPDLRRSVGTVFQTPNPLPMSIFKNISFPLKLSGVKEKQIVDKKVESALKQAFLWEEVKDRLNEDARSLSGGQQQRLCIARSLILDPEILLLDEPTSFLDAESGRIIEDLLLSIKERCTILLISHYMDQIRRIADQVETFE